MITMASDETYLGDVQDVKGTTVSIAMSVKSLTGFVYINGQGYRAGQIGSFVRIPIGFDNLFGIISQVGASAVPETRVELGVNGNRWMTVQLIGEGPKNGKFQRGLSQYPTIGDEVHLVSEKELKEIYGQPDKPYFVKLGHISNAESIPALVDINKLVTRHSAVVGTTGSGKSTTVASLMNALSDKTSYPSARIVMLDLHGEYGQALNEKANIFKIAASAEKLSKTKKLLIPFWALSFEELCNVAFGDFGNEKDKNIVMERVYKYKLASLIKYPKKGVSPDNMSVDSPVPFSLNELWHELYIDTFGTYTKKANGDPKSNIAYEIGADSKPLTGNAKLGIPPTFRNIETGAGEEKVNYLPGALGIGKQLTLLGTKLRVPRYDFIFRPERYLPDADGKTEKDIDELLKDWLGTEKPISILDLSGVPADTLQTTIGVLLRILYDAIFWARDLSQGGRHRPLLVVMEEAHIYLRAHNQNSPSQNMASTIVQRIVKEGRKYGIGAMIVSQRPSEIDPTILSQCGTVFALRLSNAQDRSHISSAMSDNLDGLTGMLPILRTGEAIILGEAVKLPMRTMVEPPPKSRRPDSQDPVVYDEVPLEETNKPGGWGNKNEFNPKYDELVEAWRAQDPRISRIVKETE